MHKNPNIRRFFAGLLLLLFVFGSTPRKTLHDFFADHKDLSARRVGDTRTAQIIDKGFSCNCESLVVEFPFTETLGTPELVAPRFSWPVKFTDLHTVYHQQLVRYSGLRGPPRV